MKYSLAIYNLLGILFFIWIGGGGEGGGFPCFFKGMYFVRGKLKVIQIMSATIIMIESDCMYYLIGIP